MRMMMLVIEDDRVVVLLMMMILMMVAVIVGCDQWLVVGGVSSGGNDSDSDVVVVGGNAVDAGNATSENKWLVMIRIMIPTMAMPKITVMMMVCWTPIFYKFLCGHIFCSFFAGPGMSRWYNSILSTYLQYCSWLVQRQVRFWQLEIFLTL